MYLDHLDFCRKYRYRNVVLHGFGFDSNWAAGVKVVVVLGGVKYVVLSVLSGGEISGDCGLTLFLD